MSPRANIGQRHFQGNTPGYNNATGENCPGKHFRRKCPGEYVQGAKCPAPDQPLTWPLASRYTVNERIFLLSRWSVAAPYLTTRQHSTTCPFLRQVGSNMLCGTVEQSMILVMLYMTTTTTMMMISLAAPATDDGYRRSTRSVDIIYMYSVWRYAVAAFCSIFHSNLLLSSLILFSRHLLVNINYRHRIRCVNIFLLPYHFRVLGP